MDTSHYAYFPLWLPNVSSTFYSDYVFYIVTKHCCNGVAIHRLAVTSRSYERRYSDVFSEPTCVDIIECESLCDSSILTSVCVVIRERCYLLIRRRRTLTLTVVQLAAATTRPALVMGAHFFSPANIMRLLENVHGKDTSPQTVATVMNFGLKIKKVNKIR